MGRCPPPQKRRFLNAVRAAGMSPGPRRRHAKCLAGVYLEPQVESARRINVDGAPVSNIA
jgi:hypothetical protein